MDNMIKKESPNWVQTSLAGAICLGLKQGKFYRNTCSTCLNLLINYTRGCSAACGYCGLGRSRQAGAKPTFIRVQWPQYAMESICRQLRTHHHPFQRICVSMVTNLRALPDTLTLVRQLRDTIDLPISVLVTPSVMKGREDFQRLQDAGVDRVGIAIDAATEALFDRYRGRGVGGPHRWSQYWQSVENALDVFDHYHTGLHFIVGLGESEKEMVDVIDQSYGMGAMTHLFSFYPEEGSLLAHHSPPPLAQYRRVQLARYLINNGYQRSRNMSFDDAGTLVDFGCSIDTFLEEGTAFMTSGCPGSDGCVACNRPFANERVSQPLRNYPFPPQEHDLLAIRNQLKVEGL